MTCQPPSECQMMGGAPAWASNGTAGARPCITMGLEPRSEAMGVMGGPTSVTLTLIIPWI